MFLHDLTAHQKKTFLILAKQFVLADSKVSPKEERHFESMRSEICAEVPSDAESYDKKELLASFDTPKSQISILLELITLGYIDGEFSEEENQFIQDLARAFRMSEDELDKYANWALKHYEVLCEGRELLGEETSS
ncbi:MAG: hypothetical protein V3W14_10690 [Candidatus Neomarinimicrobiota bacterium]